MSYINFCPVLLSYRSSCCDALSLCMYPYPSSPLQTIRRRTQFELNKVQSRDHVVEGLIRALDRIDDVVDIVRKAKDTADAKAILMSSEYEMSDAQATAILALTLGR